MTDPNPLDASLAIKRLGEDYLHQSFLLATEVFAERSTLHRALNVQLEEYRNHLWPSFQAMVSEGLSVASVDPETDNVLGCLIMTEFRKQISPPVETSVRFAPLSALTSELVQRYQSIRDLKPGEAALVDMGAVASGSGGKGIYKAMRRKADRIAHDHGFRFILGELSSSATQRVVLDQMGHQNMAEVRFVDFEHQGTRPFSSITDPACIVMSEGSLVKSAIHD